MDWIGQIWPIAAVVGIWVLLQVILKRAGVPT
jgi:hypothetical protein